MNADYMIQTILSEWETDGGRNGGYVKGYDTPEKMASMKNHFEYSVAKMIPAYKDSVGCDLGCWLGFPTLLLKSLGASHVYGIDIVPEHVQQCDEWLEKHLIEGLSFRCMRSGIVPLQSYSVDWVLINQVLCNALPDSFYATLAEANRILKPGGVLILADSNNPYCPDVLMRLKKTYLNLEVGNGTLEHPVGPNVTGRKNIIRKIAPHLSEEDMDRLSRETCYMGSGEIEIAVMRVLNDKVFPASLFRNDGARATCHPHNGAAQGNISDPFLLAREMESLGMVAHITVSPTWEHIPEESLWRDLQQSQGFYVYGKK